MMEITRTALRYHGGKWKLAPWIISHFPEHRVYTEAYGGAASILLRKAPSYAEIYNDLDDEIVNLFQVLRDKQTAKTLIDKLRLTPFSRTEFNQAYDVTQDPIEKCRRLIIRSFMGFGSDGCNAKWKTGFRANSNRSGSTPAHDWHNYPEALKAVVARLSKVTIENKPAISIMKQHDGLETLHYVDPPYVQSTREPCRKTNRGSYKHELSDNDHIDMATALHSLEGMVILSGYPCELYDQELFKNWERIEKSAHADGARERTEVLWMNNSAASNQLPLFKEGVA